MNNIKLSSLISETCNFISNTCHNISTFEKYVDEDYRENKLIEHIQVGSYYDEENGNTLFGVKSNVDQPFKVGYQPNISRSDVTSIHGAIYPYTYNDVHSDLKKFLSDECGMNINTDEDMSKKQFLIFISNIASFLLKHINYFVEADKLNLNQLAPVDDYGNIPSTNISKNILILYIPTSVINDKPTLSQIINWDDYVKQLSTTNTDIDVMDAASINTIMTNLFNNYLAVDRVKRYQYSMTVCSSSSSSSCCSSSSCSSSCSSSYFVAYMKLF